MSRRPVSTSSVRSSPTAGTGRRSARRGPPRCGGSRGATSMTAGSYGLRIVAPGPDAADRASDRRRGRPRPREPRCARALLRPAVGRRAAQRRGRPRALPRHPGLLARGDGTLTARFPTSHEATRMVHTPEQMVSELQEIHVDLAVLFPDHLLKLAVLPQADYAAALARAYNAWLVDRVDVAPRRAARARSSPARRTRRTPRARSSATPTTRRSSGLPARAPAWTRSGATARYDPIFDAAQNAGPARCCCTRSRSRRRSSRSTTTASTPSSPATRRQPHVLDHRQPDQHGLDGRRRPLPASCRIGVTEAGISWMPFLCNRLDKEYLERRREVPFLTERPSHYVKQIYVATQPIEEPERLRDIVTLMELYDGDDTTDVRLRLAAPRLRPPDEGQPGAPSPEQRARCSARTRSNCSGSTSRR